MALNGIRGPLQWRDLQAGGTGLPPGASPMIRSNSPCRLTANSLMCGLRATPFPGRRNTLGLTIWGAMMRDVSLAGRPLTHLACVIAALLPLAVSDGASADEAGVSFWLQGQYGSFAAVPSNPGWSFESTFYHAKAAASAGVSFARGGGFQAGMKSPTDFVMVTPTYVFATPVLGGQAAVGMTALYGRNTTSVSATLTGPGGASLSGSRSDYVIGFGDLYPAATLKWNQDVHNFMVYATAAVPVGVYDPTRLATMGLGHWATDAGAGYTYLKSKSDLNGPRSSGSPTIPSIPTPNTGAASTHTWIGRSRRIFRKNYTSALSAMSTTS